MNQHLGWLAWAKSKAKSLQNVIKETISQSYEFGRFVSTNIPNIFYENGIQFWEGFSRVFNPSIVSALLKSRQTRKVLIQSIPANLIIYLGSVLLYEAAIKQLLRNTISDMQDSSTEKTIDLLATFYMTRIALSMCVDNTIYNLCLNKAISEQGTKIVSPCPCGSTALIQAGLASPFYYLGNTITLHVMTSSLPLGGYLELPLRSLIYGQCFVEYKLGTAGLCTIHRYEELIKNNSFCFGLGLSFLMTFYLSNYTIYQMTNVRNEFVNDALFCCLFQHYIMLAQLIDKPLPGEKPGIDLFYHSRLVIETFLKQVCDWLIPRLKNPETRGRLENILQKINHFPLVNVLKMIFLEPGLRSSKQFVQRPATEFFFETYGETIQLAIAEIRKIRETPSIQRLHAYSPYLPHFILSKEVRSVLNIILTENLEQILSKVDNFTATARIKIKIFDKNRINKISDEIEGDIKNAFTVEVEKQEKSKLLEMPKLIEDYTGNHSDIKNVPESLKPKRRKPKKSIFQERADLTSPTKNAQKVLQWQVKQ